MPKTSPTVFISYSWDDDAHKEWVKMLADRLLDNRIEVLLDQYDATAGTDFIYFMEQAVSKANYIVMILTPNYKTKSDQRSKGVGYEQVLTSREFYDRSIEERFIIPILRKGSSEESTPRYLKSTVNLDFRDDHSFDLELEKLLKTLYDFSDKPDFKTGKLPDFLSKKKRVKATSSKHLNTKKVRYDLSSEEVLGREEELQKLLELLQKSKNLVLVSGLGGIGKTTLVNYYLSQYQNDYDHIGWVSCTGDFKNDLLASLDNETLLGKDESTDLDVRFQNKFLQLQQLSGNNLLILDNINTPEEAQEILHYKDRFPNHFQLLMTARVDLAGYPTHQIGVLDEADALALFRKHYTFKKGDTEDQLLAILQHIGRHTLVIEMLAKGMNLSGRLNLARMIERVREKGIQSIQVEAITDRAGGQNKRLNDFVAEVLDLSFKDIADENWLLLQQLAVLPSVAHEFELLAHLLGRDKEEEQDELDAQLSRLRQRGLLAYQEESVRLHPVLREVILEKEKLAYENLLIVVKRLSDSLYYDTQDKTHVLADRQPLMIYGDAVVEQVHHLEKEEVSELLDDLGGVYEEFGQYQNAAQLRERALAIAEAIFENDDKTLFIRQSNLANIYGDLGRYKEAAVLLEKVVDSAIKILGIQHHHVATYQSNLAIVYRNLGRYEEAAKLLEAALQSDLDNFGKRHPTVAVRQSNLANVYWNLGRYEEAAQLLEAALQSDLDNFGKRHPSVAVSQSNLANVYKDLGRYEEAAQLLEAALQSDLDNFGKRHPSVAIRLNNLALVFDAQQQYQSAIENWLEALQILQHNFGAQHPYIDITYNSISNTLQKGAAAGDEYCREMLAKMEG